MSTRITKARFNQQLETGKDGEGKVDFYVKVEADRWPFSEAHGQRLLCQRKLTPTGDCLACYGFKVGCPDAV